MPRCARHYYTTSMIYAYSIYRRFIADGWYVWLAYFPHASSRAMLNARIRITCAEEMTSSAHRQVALVIAAGRYYWLRFTEIGVNTV